MEAIVEGRMTSNGAITASHTQTTTWRAHKKCQHESIQILHVRWNYLKKYMKPSVVKRLNDKKSVVNWCCVDIIKRGSF